MTSIKDIYNIVKKIDLAGAPFEGAAYDLSYNDFLGLPSDSCFLVVALFGNMP
jgi:hypothetical protein